MKWLALTIALLAVVAIVTIIVYIGPWTAVFGLVPVGAVAGMGVSKLW